MEKQKKKTNKEQSNKHVKARIIPNFIFCFLAKIYLFFRLKIKHNREELKKHKEGCIILYNHYSAKDHYFLTTATNYRRINYVLTSYYFFNKILAKVLRLIRAIKKDQFKPDLMAIRQMKKVLDQKGTIAIAPAGQVSINGVRPYVSKTIVKFLRMCKTDVITLQIRGAYLMFPKWRNKDYKIQCPIETKFVSVMNKDEIPNLSDDEIFKRVLDSLDINEYHDQLTMKRKLKGKGRASGLDTILVRCPKCGSLYKNISINNELICNECHNTCVVNEYGFLNPKTIDDVGYKTVYEWYNWEEDVIKEELLKKEYSLSMPVEMYRNINKVNQMDLAGEGILYYRDNELYYEGMENGIQIRKDFALELLTQLPYSPNHHVEIPDQEGTYKFIPKNDKRQVIEWVQMIDVLTKLRGNE